VMNIDQSYHCVSADDVGASAPRTSQTNTTEASITNLLDNLISVLQCHGWWGKVGSPVTSSRVECHGHSCVGETATSKDEWRILARKLS